MSEPAAVSAYIPCYNNARSIALSIEGVRNQTHPVAELFVVDDGSTDDSVRIAEALGVRVVRMDQNSGRGAVRATAMDAARHEFVVCNDATNQLSENFVEIALKWLAQEQNVAAYGRYFDSNPHNAIDRWRARNLFKQDAVKEVVPRGSFSTYGAMAKKSAIMQAGNFNRLLRHGEDYDMSIRLRNFGNIVFDPALHVQPVVHNTLSEVMERYARWNRASTRTYTISDFIANHVSAWKILIPGDLRDRDLPAAFISATLPYFSLFHADKRSFTFNRKSTFKQTGPLQSKP